MSSHFPSVSPSKNHDVYLVNEAINPCNPSIVSYIIDQTIFQTASSSDCPSVQNKQRLQLFFRPLTTFDATADDTAIITFRAVKRSPFATTTKRRSLSHVTSTTLFLFLSLFLSQLTDPLTILMPRCLDVYI